MKMRERSWKGALPQQTNKSGNADIFQDSYLEYFIIKKNSPPILIHRLMYIGPI